MPLFTLNMMIGCGSRHCLSGKTSRLRYQSVWKPSRIECLHLPPHAIWRVDNRHLISDDDGTAFAYVVELYSNQY